MSRHEGGEPPAHETAAVLRMYRAGMSILQITRLLGMSKRQLQLELQLALDDEQDAHRVGASIHDDRIAPVEGVERNAKDVERGDALIWHNFVEHVTVVPAHYDTLNRLQDPGHVIVKLIDGGRVSFGQYDKVRVVPKSQQ